MLKEVAMVRCFWKVSGFGDVDRNPCSAVNIANKSLRQSERFKVQPFKPSKPFEIQSTQADRTIEGVNHSDRGNNSRSNDARILNDPGWISLQHCKLFYTQFSLNR